MLLFDHRFEELDSLKLGVIFPTIQFIPEAFAHSTPRHIRKGSLEQCNSMEGLGAVLEAHYCRC